LKTFPSSRGNDPRRGVRYVLSFVFTALLYAAAAYGVYRFLDVSHAVNMTQNRDQHHMLALSCFVAPAEAVAPPAPQVEEEEESEPEEEETPPPLPEPVVKEKTTELPPTPDKEPKPSLPEKVETPTAVPSPVAAATPPKPTPKAKPTPKPKPKPKPTHRQAKKKRAKKVSHTKKRRHTTSRRKSVSGGSRHLASEAAKQRFLARLRARIERGKRYPSMAKRRRLQGKVRVSFTVTATGRVQQLKLEGSKLFFSSAKKAVMQAFPISTKDAGVRFPLHVSLILRYRLH